MIKKTALLLLVSSMFLGSLQSAEPIKIGYSDWPGWTAWEIAKEKGLFKKNNVEVKLIWFPVYSDSLSALNAGQVDANSQTLSDTIFPLAEGLPLKIVLVNDNSHGNDGLIAQKGITSIKDLKGKTVATELGTCDHFLLLHALASQGMTEKDISYKNLTIPDAAAAFISGKVDAAVVWQPWLAQVQRDKSGTALYTSADMPGLIPDLLVFQEKTVTARAEDVQKVVNTWFEVVEFINSNPDEAIKIMAKVVEQKPEDYKVFLPGTKFFDREANVKAFTKADDATSLGYSGKVISEFLIKAGMLKTAPDHVSALEPKFVQASK